MKKIKKLPWQQLRKQYSEDYLNSIECLPPFNKDDLFMINQECIDLIDFGLNMKDQGYNLYLSGQDEHYIEEFIIKNLENKGSNQAVPDEVGYLYDFKNPARPKVITLAPGDGEVLKEDLQMLRQFLLYDLKWQLEEEELQKKRNKIIVKVNQKKEVCLEKLKEHALDYGFLIQSGEDGLGFLPLNHKQQPYTQETYEALPESTKEKIQLQLKELYTYSSTLLNQINSIEEYAQNEIEDLEIKVIQREVGAIMKHLKMKYSGYTQLIRYFDRITEDILEHSSDFRKGENEEDGQFEKLFPWIQNKSIEECIQKYDVNMLTNHTELKAPPIVVAKDLNYNKVIGKIQIEMENTKNLGDYRYIQGGLLHEANGGYLLIKAKDLIEYPGAWTAIKRALKKGYIELENIEAHSIITPLRIEPEPVKLQLKVIMIGDYQIYDLLKRSDPYFKELFKVHVHLKDYFSVTVDHLKHMVSAIQKYCEKESLSPLTKGAYIELFHYSNRMMEHQNKWTTELQPLLQLVKEAQVFAKTYITEVEIKKVYKMRQYLSETIQQDVLNSFKEDLLMVDVHGKKVGQINGLAVFELADFRLGKPVRITATTYRGQNGVVNVEKEVGLSGKIHSKGIQIITGFLGHYFAKERPLSLNCRICFEQSYQMIDGDSASSAELYAVLSSLADIPLDQSLAVTGSINQYGEIQPVGGINEKIEGFYKVCVKKGLNGRQGVLIPHQNCKNLVLSEEVIEAVKKGNFHIYPIETFKQAVECLTHRGYEEIEKRIILQLKRLSGDKKMKKNQ